MPWETSARCDVPEGADLEWTIVMEGGGDMLADLTGCPDAEGNAAFIVRACNAHDDMVESVKRLLNCMDIAGWEGDPAAEFARAALAKAGAA